MTFEDTHSDLDFERRIKEANQDWMRQVPRAEPDLYVEGLVSSLTSRILSLFSGTNGR